MSDNSANQDTAPEQSGPAQLREALERAKQQLAERDQQIASLTQAARDSAFDQAGVPAEAWGAAFRQTYDGPIDTNAIAEKVKEWGIPVPAQADTQPQAQAEPQVVDPAEAQALAQAQQVRNMPPAAGQGTAQEAFARLAENGDFTPADIARLASDYGLIELSD